MKHLFFTMMLIAMSSGPFAFAQSTLQFDTNVSPALKSLIQSDLQALSLVEGNGQSNLQMKLWGPFNGKNLSGQFLQKFRTVSVFDADDCGLLCVIPSFSHNTIYMNPNYYPGIEPMVARWAQYLFATKVEQTPPVTCPTPFLDDQGHDVVSMYSHIKMEGTDNCDNSVYGAYASVAVLLSNIASYCSNCSLETKTSAKSLSLYYLQKVIDPDAKALILKDSF